MTSCLCRSTNLKFVWFRNLIVFLGDFMSLRHDALWFYQCSRNKSGKYSKRCTGSRRKKISGNGSRFDSKSSQLVKGKVPVGNFSSNFCFSYHSLTFLSLPWPFEIHGFEGSCNFSFTWLWLKCLIKGRRAWKFWKSLASSVTGNRKVFDILPLRSGLFLIIGKKGAVDNTIKSSKNCWSYSIFSPLEIYSSHQ